jgi:outer membrane protein TolC
MNKVKVLVILILLCFSNQLFAEDILEKVSSYEYSLKDSLSLKQVINIVLSNSLKAKSALYQIPQSNSDKLKYNTQFSPYVGFQHQQYNLYNKNSQLAAFIENNSSFTQQSLAAGKKFETETEVTVGLSKSDIKGIRSTAIPQSASGSDDPMSFFSIKQSLLKNGFGRNNSNMQKILDNQIISKENQVSYQLALIVSESIMSYWTVIENQRNYKNEEIKELAYLKIKKAIKSNVNLGLMESDSLHQYNALILSSSSKKDINRNSYYESLDKLSVLLNKNLHSSKNIEIADLEKGIMSFNPDNYIKKALNNRADYQNILLSIESLKLKNSITKNESLPDMSLKYQVSNIPDGGGLINPGSLLHSFDFGISYLLDNKMNTIELRDNNYQITQLELQKKQLEKEITSEVNGIAKKIEVIYSSYLKSKEARNEASIYFNLLLKKLRQGRINSVQLTDAVNMMVNVREFETTMLITYNKLLLGLKLTTNTLFESYDIDIDTYLDALISKEN